MYRASECIGCKSCRTICPEGAIGDSGPVAIDRTRCNLCGTCTDECPSGALSIVGRHYTVDELVQGLVRDKAFYDNSGGGVTLSGGEPTLYMDYSSEVARELNARGVRVGVETCGDFEWERFSEELLPHCAFIFVDMKFMDEELHKYFTGRDNSRIMKNIENIVSSGRTEYLIRVPLVPQVTATPENLSAIAKRMRELGLNRVALLPYNPLWIAKTRGLGRSLRYERHTWMSREERKVVKDIFQGFHIERGFGDVVDNSDT